MTDLFRSMFYYGKNKYKQIIIIRFGNLDSGIFSIKVQKLFDVVRYKQELLQFM